MRKIIKCLRPSEWVCLGYFSIVFLALGLKSKDLDWSGVRWEVFPKLDLLFISISVWTIKITRNKLRERALLISLSVICFYAFAGNLGESIFPIRESLSISTLNQLQNLRWIFAIALIGIFYRVIRNDKKIELFNLWQEAITLVPLFIVILTYPFIPLLINSTGFQDRDLQLKLIDSFIFFGKNPILMMERWITPQLSEWMALSYTSYGLLFSTVFACLYLKTDKKPINDLLFMTTLALAMGYLSYVLVPAKGPLFVEKFSQSLDLYYMKDIKEALMDHTRIERDCFPSLHTAISLITLIAAWRYIRFLFWLFLPISIFIPIACVYLRYHYVTDVIAGLVLALLISLFSKQLTRVIL